MAAIVGNLLPGTVFVIEQHLLGRWKSISVPYFDDISQSTAEIKLLPVSENACPPYWNSTSGFDFDLRVVIVMSFLHLPSNFVVIGRSAAELWRNIDFFKMAAIESEIYFQILFCDGVRLGRWKCISLPNFYEISLSVAEIKLLPLLDNGRPPYWNSTFGFDFDRVVIGMSFYIRLPNFVIIGWSPAELWRHIDFPRWRP